MLHISTQKLIEKLLERTQKGTIDWKEREPEGVILETEGYVVELTGSPATVKLSHVNGRLLEDVTTEVLESAQDSTGRTFASIVTELEGEANRFAKGTEQAIASILDAVEASTTPIKKSGPAFPGQPHTDASPSVSEEQTESSIKTNSDPATEAGMSAAVVKMVAEINGSTPVSGDELDHLAEETSSVEETVDQVEPENLSIETITEPKLTDFDAEALLSAELPPEPVPELPEAPQELATDSAIEETSQELEEPIEEVPEFKTHVVDTPAIGGFAAGSMAAAAAAAASATQSKASDEEVSDLVSEAPTPSDIEPLNEEIEIPEALDNSLEIPPIPSTPELETAFDEPPQTDSPSPSTDLKLDTEEVLPPPPPPMSAPDFPEDTVMEIEEELVPPASLEGLEPPIEAPIESSSEMHFQPFAKRTAELAAAEQELETSIEETPPLPFLDEDAFPPVAEAAAIAEEPALPSLPVEKPAVETPPEPITEPVQEPPPSIGFSFKNKVTATGLTIAGNIGTLIPGVPDDIRQRADDHERIARLQKEKAEAEERAAKAKKAADEAASARKSTIGFKSWS